MLDYLLLILNILSYISLVVIIGVILAVRFFGFELNLKYIEDDIEDLPKD